MPPGGGCSDPVVVIGIYCVCDTCEVFDPSLKMSCCSCDGDDANVLAEMHRGETNLFTMC